jgi:hypothetical protein
MRKAARNSLVLSLLMGVGFLTNACSSSSEVTPTPVEVTQSFVNDYGSWARDGYPSPVPDALLTVSTDEMVDVLERDLKWNSRGEIQQHGEVEIVSIELVESEADRATVRVVLDGRNLTVTASGEETWVDYSRPVTTQFHLVNDRSWRIASTETK